MFDKISRSWHLVKASAAVLRTDKELLLFPVISGFATLLVALTFLLPVRGLRLFEGGQIGPVGFESKWNGRRAVNFENAGDSRPAGRVPPNCTGVLSSSFVAGADIDQQSARSIPGRRHPIRTTATGGSTSASASSVPFTVRNLSSARAVPTPRVPPWRRGRIR